MAENRETSLAEEKTQIRRELKSQLANISHREKTARCAGLLPQIAKLDAYRRACCVLAYWPMGDELPIVPLLQGMLEAGKAIYLPRIDDNKEGMVFRLWKKPGAPRQSPDAQQETGLKNGLESGNMGFFQPSDKASAWNREIHLPALMLVPGLGFTRQGARLGRGGGYYDRFLEAHQELPTLGACLEEQLRKHLPTNDDDAVLEYIITC